MKPDYKLAAEELSAIIERRNLSLRIDPHPHSDYSEKGRQRFLFILSSATDSIAGDFSCGSTCALSAYIREPFPVKSPTTGAPVFRTDALRAARAHRPSLADESPRMLIRMAYRPSLADVVGCLLSDASCVDGHSDWLEWAEELGYEGAKSLREAREAWRTIQQRAPILRRMLGEDYDAALDAARRL